MKNIFYYKWTLIVGYLLICLACHSERDRFNECIENISDKYHIEKSNYIVIVPSQGCGGCITYAEEFYHKNSNRKNIFFIFTNIISVKMLQQKIDLNRENVYLDNKNNFLQAYPTDKKLYPAVLKLEKGRVVEVYYQSPEENGLAKIYEI